MTSCPTFCAGSRPATTSIRCSTPCSNPQPARPTARIVAKRNPCQGEALTFDGKNSNPRPMEACQSAQARRKGDQASFAGQEGCREGQRAPCGAPIPEPRGQYAHGF